MIYSVTHKTRYEYPDAVALSHNLVRMRPRDHVGQVCRRHELKVSPMPAMRSDRLDYFGNHLVWLSLQEPHTELLVESKSEVEVVLELRPELSRGTSWERVADIIAKSGDPNNIALRQFTFDSLYVQRSSELASYALGSFLSRRAVLECVSDLNRRIHEEFEYVPGSTRVGTMSSEVLRLRRGVCQDFAHLAIGCLRSLGLAARYVSGYIATTPPPGKERLVGADASHAWIGVFTPDFGWVDFDPTNGVMPTDSHVTVAWGRDYDDVGPFRGILMGGQRQRLNVSVDVVPLEDTF